jgi:hypothetical protein
LRENHSPQPRLEIRRLISEVLASLALREHRFVSKCRVPTGVESRSTKQSPLPIDAEQHWKLLQLPVLGIGLLQDGDIRVGFFPEG